MTGIGYHSLLLALILCLYCGKGGRGEDGDGHSGDSDDCGEGTMLITDVFQKMNVFDCDDFMEISDTLYDECKVEDEFKGLEGMRKIIKTYKQLDCDDDRRAKKKCGKAVKCVEGLFEKHYSLFDCGIDNKDLEDAIDCLNDEGRRCTFSDAWEKILESDETKEICERARKLEKVARAAQGKYTQSKANERYEEDYGDKPKGTRVGRTRYARSRRSRSRYSRSRRVT